MKRTIALRKQHKVFGRGRTTFLSPDNRKILAYIRHDETDTILVLANLSHQVQPVELDLSAYEGLMPQEMIRRCRVSGYWYDPVFSVPGTLCVLLVHSASP